MVVLVPESGDAIQAMKAGLMEIADIFVVNKSDRPGADRLVKDLRQALHLKAGNAMKDMPAHHGVDLARIAKEESTTDAPPIQEGGWQIPVLSTVALTGEGVGDLLAAVDAHREWLGTSGQIEVRRRARARVRVQDVVDRELRRVARRSEAAGGGLEPYLDQMRDGTETAYSVAAELLKRLLH